MKIWWPDLDGAGGSLVEPANSWQVVVRRVVRRGWLEPAALWALSQGRADIAMELATRAVALRQDAGTLHAACRTAFLAARLEEAMAWADRLQSGRVLSDADQQLIGAVRERQAVLNRLGRLAGNAKQRAPRRVLALLAYSLPHTSNGYATRSHGLLTAVSQRGWDVHPFTRPGYPMDSNRALTAAEVPSEDVVGALRYGRLLRSTRRSLGHMSYIHAAADEVREEIDRLKPCLVHAASNYMTALPACIAAHEAGLPFVYEVRGFWDVTRLSSDPAFARSTEYRYLRLFETALLKRADAIVTLTQAMRQELARRGAPLNRIEVAPNAVDVERADPRPRDHRLLQRLRITSGVPVIGYAGSFVDYEGLDDLIDACALLRRAGKPFHLLLVGDGLAMPMVVRQIEELKLGDQVTLAGRVPHEEVADYYGVMDICPFPRKPWPVCELVSPLKPFEAMALEKAVLVSSVAAMAEMIEDGVNGRIFNKGSVEHLASRLGSMIDDIEAARALGRLARQWVQRSRTWRVSAVAVERAYFTAVANYTNTEGSSQR